METPRLFDRAFTALQYDGVEACANVVFNSKSPYEGKIRNFFGNPEIAIDYKRDAQLLGYNNRLWHDWALTTGDNDHNGLEKIIFNTLTDLVKDTRIVIHYTEIHDFLDFNELLINPFSNRSQIALRDLFFFLGTPYFLQSNEYLHILDYEEGYQASKPVFYAKPTIDSGTIEWLKKASRGRHLWYDENGIQVTLNFAKLLLLSLTQIRNPNELQDFTERTANIVTDINKLSATTPVDLDESPYLSDQRLYIGMQAVYEALNIGKSYFLTHHEVFELLLQYKRDGKLDDGNKG